MLTSDLLTSQSGGRFGIASAGQLIDRGIMMVDTRICLCIRTSWKVSRIGQHHLITPMREINPVGK